MKRWARLGLAGAVTVAALVYVGMLPVVATGIAQVVQAVTAPAEVTTPAPTPTPDPVPTVAAPVIPSPGAGGGVDVAPAAPGVVYGNVVPSVDVNGKAGVTCPIHGASDPICSGVPVSGCAPGQTTLTPQACQDPSVAGCPGAIHYPNGFTSLPPCVRPTPIPSPTPVATPAPTPSPSP